MRLIGKSKLIKLKAKNKGNKSLAMEIDNLISDIEKNNWKNEIEVKASRSDADCVHNDGFYFFDIEIHRTMILLEFGVNREATIIWTGIHDDYERIFKNNKATIAKWLKKGKYI